MSALQLIFFAFAIVAMVAGAWIIRTVPDARSRGEGLRRQIAAAIVTTVGAGGLVGLSWATPEGWVPLKVVALVLWVAVAAYVYGRIRIWLRALRDVEEQR